MNHHEIPSNQDEISWNSIWITFRSLWCLLGVSLVSPCLSCFAPQQASTSSSWQRFSAVTMRAPDAKELGAFRMGFPNGSFHGEYIYIYHIHHIKYHERNHIYAIKWYHIWYISYGIMCIYIYIHIYIYGAPQKKTTMVFCFYCYLQCFYITFIIYYTQWAWYGIYVINNMI